MGSAISSTSNFETASQPFVDAGISGKALIPVAPVGAEIAPGIGELEEKVLGKAPGRYDPRTKTWRGLFGGFLAEGVPERDQNSFLKWPTPNVGLLGRFFPGIDSDAVTEAGRVIVEEALDEAFGDSVIAERLRGKGPRRLYTFRAAMPDDVNERVRTRHVAYKLKGDGENAPPQKLDVIGYGAQYLIAGKHQSGDSYRWRKGFELVELAPDLLEITNDDVERFLDILKRMVEARGGEWLRSTGGRAPGEERDYSNADPIVDPADLLSALKDITNDETHFPHREQAVALLGNVRAALGAEAEQYEDEICDWFTEPGWADEDYFRKIWRSLDRGVRCSQDAIMSRLRAVGNNLSAREEFGTDHAEEMAPHREKRKKAKHEREGLLQDARARYVFGELNARDDAGTYTIRPVMNAGLAYPAEKWWKGQTVDQHGGFLAELWADDRYAGPAGLYTFLNDMKARFPDSFFMAETRNPNYDRGDIVPEVQQDGSISYSINMRYMSAALRYSNFPGKDRKRDAADVETILEFMGRLFGAEGDERHLNYELDTLAFMVQTKKRPGHLLFLVGDQGVGKSIYLNMLVSIFDGIGRDQGGHIDGTKITNDSARRFALAKVEGCRIISVKELPEGGTAAQMANILSTLKQVVDAGPDADWIQIERKGKDSHSVENFARVVISSNYTTAIPVEEQDRRTFYVICGIDQGNKPNAEYYSRLVDITTDPKRLAAFIRYLRTRDVTDYKASAAPPVTRAKAAAQLEMMDPVERHARAALELLRVSGRWIFDVKELCNVMTWMGENEFANTGRNDRREYDPSDKTLSATITRFLKRDLEKLSKDWKKDGGSVRVSAIYALRRKKDLWEKAEGRRNAVLDLLDDNREDVPRLRENHPIADFEGFASVDDRD